MSDYEWWHRALRGEKPPIHENEVHCGWYKRKLVKNGPWVGVVIWRGTDQELYAQVNGIDANPASIWTWVCGNPITVEDFNSLTGGESKSLDTAEPAFPERT